MGACFRLGTRSPISTSFIRLRLWTSPPRMSILGASTSKVFPPSESELSAELTGGVVEGLVEDGKLVADDVLGVGVEGAVEVLGGSTSSPSPSPLSSSEAKLPAKGSLLFSPSRRLR